jgi:hypothetical protein
LLKSRIEENVTQEEMSKFASALRIFPTNQSAENFATNVIRNLGINVITFESLVKSENNVKRQHDDYPLLIYPEARVQLKKNLSTTYGLTNGTLGNIVKVIYYNKDHPSFIIVKFDNWMGKEIQGGVPVKLETEVFEEYIARKFPLRQALSQTLHKVQGLTLSKVVLYFTAREIFTNYSYCGLSRVAGLANILIGDSNLHLSRFQSPSFMRGHAKQIKELDRLGAI